EPLKPFVGLTDPIPRPRAVRHFLGVLADYSDRSLELPGAQEGVPEHLQCFRVAVPFLEVAFQGCYRLLGPANLELSGPQEEPGLRERGVCLNCKGTILDRVVQAAAVAVGHS